MSHFYGLSNRLRSACVMAVLWKKSALTAMRRCLRWAPIHALDTVRNVCYGWAIVGKQSAHRSWFAPPSQPTAMTDPDEDRRHRSVLFLFRRYPASRAPQAGCSPVSCRHGCTVRLVACRFSCVSLPCSGNPFPIPSSATPIARAGSLRNAPIRSELRRQNRTSFCASQPAREEAYP